MNARLAVLLLKPKPSPADEYAQYDGGAHKLLSDNRLLYIMQSARTKDGQRAEFTTEGEENE